MKDTHPLSTRRRAPLCRAAFRRLVPDRFCTGGGLPATGNANAHARNPGGALGLVNVVVRGGFDLLILPLCGRFLSARALAGRPSHLALDWSYPTVFAGLLPVSGGVGVIEAGLSHGLTRAGVPSEAAFAIALAYRFVTFCLPPRGCVATAG